MAISRALGVCPALLVEAMTHYPDADFQGQQSGIVATIGLAVKLVSAISRKESCLEPDNRLSSTGITGEGFEGICEQLSDRLVKTRINAKVLIG